MVFFFFKPEQSLPSVLELGPNTLQNFAVSAFPCYTCLNATHFYRSRNVAFHACSVISLQLSWWMSEQPCPPKTHMTYLDPYWQDFSGQFSALLSGAEGLEINSLFPCCSAEKWHQNVPAILFFFAMSTQKLDSTLRPTVLSFPLQHSLLIQPVWLAVPF